MQSPSVPDRPVVTLRRMIVSLVVALALGTSFATAVGASQVVSGRVSATSSVNIRACAALDCLVIGTASLGDAIEVTGDPLNGFYPVLWYGREGYAYELFVDTNGEAPWLVEGEGDCNRVALVFNIGIGEAPSQTIVDTLVETGTPASMFPMGWWALENPGYLTQLDDSGFLIGTHGDQQLLLTSASNEAIAADVSNSVAAIESVIGRGIDQYFTPYAADTDERVRSIVSELGLLPVGWNVAGMDFGPDPTAESVYDLVMNGVYPGAIVELHLDGPATESSTALALPGIIGDLDAAGYELVTVADLLLPCGG